VIAASANSIHVHFGALEELPARRVEAFLETIDRADVRFVDAVKDAATRIGRSFEAAIDGGRINERGLFDFNYRPIPDTSPPQFLTPFTALCDDLLPPIQEPLLAMDPRIVFCAAVDTNAYLPTHNRKFSLPQRPGDQTWNVANSRHRRFFKDSAGLRAARTTRDFLMQTYERDLGGGEIVNLKEIDVPIYVRGKHWGGMRLGFRA
jgi:methyl-accepting chemotaxis protein